MADNFNLEASDLIPQIKTDINRKIILAAGFFLLLILLRTKLGVPFPKELFLLVIIIALGGSALMYFFRKFGVEKPLIVVKVHFGYNIAEAALLTIMIYYVGGITWIAPIFYSFNIINGFWFYPRKLAVILLISSAIFLTSLVILEYLGILPAFYVFPPSELNFKNPYYTLTTTTAALIVLLAIGFFSNTFYTLLIKQIEGLKVARNNLEEAKRNFEAEVFKKTKETGEEKKRLEEEIEERTKELGEGKRIVQEKVRELERLHDFAVNRELEMIELKREIKKFKKA
jgi:hypothetical protein